MAKRIKIKKKLVLHPVMGLLCLSLIVIVLSGILSLLNFSFTYNAINIAKLDYKSTTEAIESLFSLHGVKYIFSNTVLNFANFTALSHLIIILLGIGVMEYTGFLKTAIGVLTKKAKKNAITFTLILVCLIASMIDNVPFIAFIPLAALIYKYGRRNPGIGIIASFGALTTGYGLSILFTSIDSQLRTLSLNSASILNPNYKFSVFSMVLIMAIATIIMAFVLTYITENIVARKLPKYEFEEDEVLEDKELTKKQKKGLLLSGLGSALYLIIIIYNVIPGLPLSGNFLNYRETLYIDKLFGVDSFFSNGFVFIVTILFIIWGLLYGIGANTIKNNSEFIDALGFSLNGVGKTLVYIFAGATFISIFKQTNIGTVITVGLTQLVVKSEFTGLALVILFFIVNMIATLVLPGSVARWSIMSSQIVPTFLNVGISAEFLQVVFRFSECVTIGLTPVFAYFIIYLSYLEKYSQDEKGVRLTSSIKYQIPYSIGAFVVLFSLIILWYLISLPLGVHGVISI